MPPTIDIQNLDVRYGDTTAVDNLNVRLAGGRIHGLLGRNGSGKTSLLGILAAFRQASSGRVLVDGEDPFENAAVMRSMCFVREDLDVYPSDSVKHALAFAAQWNPNWDDEYAKSLAERFELPLRRPVNKLSRGMKSALGVTIGLASRAPLTIFDEAYLGMDAPSRYAFYDELLADYMTHPRTIIMSTHLIDEVSSLFEEVLIIHRGALVAQDDTDALRTRGAAVVGPANAVDELTADLTVLGEQQLGATKSATVYGQLPATFEQQARAVGVDLGPVALQDLFVHLTKDGLAQDGGSR